MTEAAATTSAAELAALFPQPVTIEAGGKKLALKPLSIRKIGAVAAAVGPALDAFNADQWSFALLGSHAEQTIKAVAIAIDEPEEWVAELPFPEFVVLAKKVFDLNRDFFVRRAAPEIGGLLAVAAKRTKADGDGPTSSTH